MFKIVCDSATNNIKAFKDIFESVHGEATEDGDEIIELTRELLAKQKKRCVDS